MAKVIPGRMSADLEGDFVVFLIGMRFNRPWHLRKVWLAFTAMPRMLRYLYQHPERGLLGHTLAVFAARYDPDFLAVLTRHLRQKAHLAC